MSEILKKFIINNFDINKQQYACNPYTLHRILLKHGYCHSITVEDRYFLNDYTQWYQDIDGDVITINVSGANWYPIFHGKEDVPQCKYSYMGR